MWVGLSLWRHDWGEGQGVTGDESQCCVTLTTVMEENLDDSPPVPGRKVDYKKVPWGVWTLEKLGLCCYPKNCHKVFVYLLTFIAYVTFHLSRKPFSVVKVVLCPRCAEEESTNSSDAQEGWPPFDSDHGRTQLGAVDNALLFTYAIAMFFSGWIGDRVNLRYFLTIGMIGSGLSTCLLGVAYFAEIHHIAYFIVIQLFGGILQSTGWPSVISVMTHWFGKQRRGLLMGIWGSNPAVGGILGTIIPSFWADTESSNPPWGWSFIVPGFIIAGMGVVIFFFLVTDPQYVGLPPPVHNLKSEKGGEKKREVGNGEVIVEATEVDTENQSAAGSQAAKASQEGEEKATLERERSNVQLLVELGEVPPVQSNGGVRRSESHVHLAKKNAVGFLRALMIPGVIEYSLSVFFSKLVSYSFFYWLPFYVKVAYPRLSGEEAAWLSTLFDVGGIIGSIGIGLFSDILNARAVIILPLQLLSIPSLFVLRFVGDVHLALYSILLLLTGGFINGPLSIIFTAVSSDLGTHKSLSENQNAKATVTAIIDGTGSLGAAFGPLIVGAVSDESGWNSVFYVFMGACLLSALFLSRLGITEGLRLARKLRGKKSKFSTNLILTGEEGGYFRKTSYDDVREISFKT